MKNVFLVLALLSFPTILQAQTGMTPIKLYFHNEAKNPNAQDCNKVFPVTRKIPKTKAIARAALDELLKGPTKEEAAKEFWGFGPPDTDGILKSIRIKNGAAYVNFTSQTLEQMGNATTSCGGAAFFSMVEKTLTQFPSIRKVYYAIDGDTDLFYEWVQVGECPHGRHCAKKNFQ